MTLFRSAGASRGPGMSGFVIGDDHPALPGHFPGRPIVPGVVIVDRVLDAIEAAHGPLGALRLPQVKFLRPLLPGQAALVEIEAVAPSQPDAPARSEERRGGKEGVSTCRSWWSPCH